MQGERNGKKNLFSFPLPSRSLSWAKPKIVQGERNGKKNLFSFPLPSRSLSWAKPEIAKTNGKNGADAPLFLIRPRQKHGLSGEHASPPATTQRPSPPLHTLLIYIAPARCDKNADSQLTYLSASIFFLHARQSLARSLYKIKRGRRKSARSNHSTTNNKQKEYSNGKDYWN